jgi:hypothetical protein
VESHFDGLMELQRRLDVDDRLTFEAPKFIVEAQKPSLAPGIGR